MNPMFFGASSHALFGIYEPAVGTPRGGVVLCYPWGKEYILAHRSFRFLSSRLAAAGLHVLRFDYYGTGDSAGESTEGDVERWVSDIATAIDELKDTAQVRRVGLAGLRFGATLAALAAAGRSDVGALALWNPLFDGPGYLDELLSSDRPPTDDEPPPDARGFPLTAPMQQTIGGLSLASIPGPLPRTLLVSSEDDAPPDDLRSAIASCATDHTVRHEPGPPVWSDDEGYGSEGMPVNAVRVIVDWLAEPA